MPERIEHPTHTNIHIDVQTQLRQLWRALHAIPGPGLLHGPLGLTELTSATTLTSADYDKMFVLAGGSPYTVTLPPVAAAIERQIFFRAGTNAFGDYPLGAVVTLAANPADGTPAIDGANNRIIWAGESALLWSDGAHWFKLVRMTIPMACTMRLSSGSPGAAQSVPDSTVTQVNLTGVDLDNTSLMADATNHRINIKRSGVYDVRAQVYWSAPGAGTRFIADVYKNGTHIFSAETSLYAAGGYPVSTTQNVISLAAGDYIDLRCYQNTGSTQQLYGDPVGASCLLTALELPAW